MCLRSKSKILRVKNVKKQNLTHPKTAKLATLKRCAKFIWSCFNSHNLIVRNISMAAKISSFSDFGDNYRYLSYKYGIGIHVWHLPLCKLYKCFDVFLLNHHKTIANGVFIRDLCLLRENNIVDDDQDLTSTELTYMIDFLCTS